MEGDVVNPAELVRTARAHGSRVMMDEAHNIAFSGHMVGAAPSTWASRTTWTS